MYELELIHTAERLVRDVIGYDKVNKDTKVLVVTDPARLNIGKTFALVCRGLGAETVLSLMHMTGEHGNEPPAVIAAAGNGIRWLLDLQNRDGGIPTFCRGWGALPFDRSATDLTAHALRAWMAWRGEVDAALRARIDRRRPIGTGDVPQIVVGNWLADALALVGDHAGLQQGGGDAGEEAGRLEALVEGGRAERLDEVSPDVFRRASGEEIAFRRERGGRAVEARIGSQVLPRRAWSVEGRGIFRVTP